MQYREMISTGDQLSALGFGCMRFPEKRNRIDEEKSRAMIYKALDSGVNYFDTGFPYHMGQSEPFLGKVFRSVSRNKIKIASKLPATSINHFDDMNNILDNQLKRLQTDYIDYYLLHGIEEKAWNKFLNLDVFNFLEKAKKAGKIINIGFSFHGDLNTFKEIIDFYPWQFTQIQYNYFDQQTQAGTAGLEYAAAKNMGIIIMEPLRGGLLTQFVPEKISALWKKSHRNWTPAEWALKWVWNRPEVSVVLSGMTEMCHVEENVRIATEAFANNLSVQDLELVEEVRASYQELLQVGCTGCRYCMPCPAGVNIPLSFELYNRVRSFGESRFNNYAHYAIHMGGFEGKKEFASQCRDCKICIDKCPQKINIPEELQKVSRTFETLFFKFFCFFGKGFMKSISKK